MKTLRSLQKVILLVLSIICFSCAEDGVEPMDQDTTAPTISTTSIINGATDVSVDVAISVTFSEEVNANTVTSANFNLKPTAAAGLVSGSISVNGRTITFTQSASLDYETEFRLLIDDGIEDLAGNSLTSSTTISFTTEVMPDNVAPTVTAVSPEDGTTNVQPDVNISITFSEEIESSSISASSLEIHVTGESGLITGTGSFSGNTYTYDPASDLMENVEYTIKLNDGVKDLAGNGLESFESTFTTATLDNEAPSVVSWSVSNGETNIAVDASFTITFSEPMDAASFPGNITIRRIGTTVFEDMNYQVSGNDVIATPMETMQGNSQYSVNVSTDVTDLAGNRLNFSSSRIITTENIPVTIIDNTHPEGAEDIKIDESITITFSKDIKDFTVNSTSFKVTKTSGVSSDIDGTYQTNGASVTFTPNDVLIEKLTNYQITLSADGIEDVDGNVLGTAKTFDFTTELVSENFYYRLTNNLAGDNVVLTAPDVSPTNVALSAANDNDDQLWRFIKRPSGSYWISTKKFGTDNVLTTDNLRLISTDFSVDPGGTPSEEIRSWTLTETESDGLSSPEEFLLKNDNYGANFALDDDLDMKSLTGNTDQSWFVTRIEAVN